MTDGPLGLDAETMRELGYRTVDLLVERLSDASAPPLRRATPAKLAARLHGPAPADGESYDAILGRLATDVLPSREPQRPSRLLRVRPVLGHLAGRAWRSHRERVQRLRRLVD